MNLNHKLHVFYRNLLRYQLPENASCVLIGGWHHSSHPCFWFEGTKTKDTKQKQAVSAQVIIKRVWNLRNVPKEFPKKTAGRETQRDVGNEERKLNQYEKSTRKVEG